MTIRPIIFSAPMVRALLEGRKTQTRRVLKPKRGTTIGDCIDAGPAGIGRRLEVPVNLLDMPYDIGDLLYVREAFAIHGNTIIYRTLHPESDGIGPRVDLRWKPSIHMPRWASRLTLVATDVRVQRLNEISEDDAMAEGVEPLYKWSLPHCEAFARLWNTLHGSNAWAENPGVGAVTFTVHKVNVDHFADATKMVAA